MNIWICLAVYWVACCIIGYVIRSRFGKNTLPNRAGRKNILWVHLQIILLCWIAVPVLLFAFAYNSCRRLYYKNRPRPLPKDIKKYVKKDSVLDENNSAISIVDYNYKHGTNYTLDDVYGKGYIDSLSEDEKTDLIAKEASYGVLEIQENIPETKCTEAARFLGSALLTGDFRRFESLLNKDVEHISYESETILGRDKVVEYWKGWRSRWVETRKTKTFKVVYSNYYSNACLLMDMMVVMFYIKDNRIRKILLIQRHLNMLVTYHNDILDFPFKLESISHCLSDIRESKPVVRGNRIPCFSCGTSSEKLEWHTSFFQFADIGYSGTVSVCPHCHKVVEYNPEARHRCQVPIDPRKCKNPMPHKWAGTDIDEGNIFASKAKEYHWRIKTNLDSLEKKGDDAAFWDLDSLSLEEGYHLGLRLAEPLDKGDVSNFYVYDKNGEEDKDLLKYLHVEETAMGVWQLYLLMTSPTLLPTFWHGAYNERKYILKENDLYEIEPLKCFDLSYLTKQRWFCPSVEVEDSTGVFIAQIHCLFWNEWKGLVKDHVEITMCKGKLISYEEKDQFVIYKYNCGIFL